jgi:hypothetical protein
LIAIAFQVCLRVKHYEVSVLPGCLQTVMYKSADCLCKGTYCTENPEYLLVASKKSVLEVNTDKTMYRVMTQDQTAGRSQYIQIDGCSIEREDEFKYVGTTYTNENSIQEEIRSKWKSVNDFHSMQIYNLDIMIFNFACCVVWV